MAFKHRLYYEDDVREGVVYPGAGRPQVQRKKWLDVNWSFTEQAPLGLLSGFEVVILNGSDPDNPAQYVRAPETVAPDVRRYTIAVAVGTDLTNARAAVRAVYGASKSAWTLQGVGQLLAAEALALGTEQDVADALSAAATAQADASNALADAAANTARHDDVAADGKLSAAEKKWARLEYNRLLTDQASIEASADAFGITSEKSDFTSAVSALTSYLQGLSPAWDDPSAATSISRTLYLANWDAVYDARQVLLNEISRKAGTLAEWEQIQDPTGSRREERARIKSMRNTFLEDFTDSDWRYYWTQHATTGSRNVLVTSSATAVGGRAAELGNTASNSQVWMSHPERIPFDPNKLYRMEISFFVRNEGDTDRVLYLGVNGYDGSGNLCNTSGLNTHSSQHYFCASNYTPPLNSWRILSCYFKGFGTTGAVYSSTVGANNIGNPAKMHPDVRYFSPMILANYSAKVGRTIIGYIKIDVVEVQNQRNLPMVQSDVASVPLSQVSTAVDAGSTATINIAAHSVQFGSFSVAYSSGSISGLLFSKKYFVYCDDPTYGGGAVTYYATTNWATAKGADHRRLVDVITTPANGGSSSGGGATPPEECVDYDTVLPDGRYLRNVAPGELVDCIDVATGERGYYPLLALGEGWAECYALQTPEGAEVWQSDTTPMDMPGGGAPVRTPQMLGKPVYILEDGVARLSVVSSLQPLGRRRVLKPNLGNRMFFAGTRAAQTIATHNVYYKP